MSDDIRDELTFLARERGDSRLGRGITGAIAEITGAIAALTALRARNERLSAAADQAISNLRAIVALNDNRHIEEICHITAELLSIAREDQTDA